jgi:two-component system chemotaxis sensor kinase CheA
VDSSRYAQLFLTESREHLSAINLALLELERASAAGAGVTADEQRPAITSLFRAVHTMKGMSATMGYTDVAALAHEMEAVLDGLRQRAIEVNQGLMDALFKAADGLESSIERAVAGEAPHSEIASLAKRLHEFVPAAISSPAPPAPGSRPKPTSGRPVAKGRAGSSGRAGTAGHSYYLRIELDPDAPLRGVRAAMALQRLRSAGDVTGIAPSEESFKDEDFGDVFDCKVRSAMQPAELERAVMSVGDISSVQVATRRSALRIRAALPRLTADAPEKPIAKPASSRRLSGPTGRSRQDFRRTMGVPVEGEQRAGPPGAIDRRTRHVRIDLARLDSLMNLIGELVIARGRLAELTGAREDAALTETVAQVTRLIGDLHEEILTCRMVPVWQVFDRFPRLVRDAAQTLGKRVNFDVDGKEIELDRSMLDEIGDPIVHLLRNALDHGIEPPSERVAAGKRPEGRLTLSAVRDRSAVLIRVTDDGRGIDRAKVLARALESGLVDPGTTALTDEEVIRLIARPGFTTADQVTDISGRGVGIDAVQGRVRALGGVLEIKTVPGQGTTVTARLPLTLAIMRALLARIGGETYAFPMGHVDETVATEGAAFAAVRGQPVLILRGDALPYHRLRELVALPDVARETPKGDPEQNIVVVEAGGQRAAVAVDELTGQQDIVVKQFDAVRGGAALFSGATILGDGAPALIVDVSSLF